MGGSRALRLSGVVEPWIRCLPLLSPARNQGRELDEGAVIFIINS